MLSSKLLEPGWGGSLGPDEVEFIKRALKADRRLRPTWGMGRGHGRISEAKIREVAMTGHRGGAFYESTGDFHDGLKPEGGEV